MEPQKKDLILVYIMLISMLLIGIFLVYILDISFFNI